MKARCAHDKPRRLRIPRIVTPAVNPCGHSALNRRDMMMESKPMIRPLPLTRLLVPVLLVLGVAACHQEGPAERAGRSIDRAGQNLRDAVDPPQGPAERAGRTVDRALQ